MASAMDEETTSKKYGVRHVACQACRLAHTACDGQRPCRRCVGLNRGHECVDAAPKKRGRPAGKKNGEDAREGGLFHFTFQTPKRAKAQAQAPGSAAQAQHQQPHAQVAFGHSGAALQSSSPPSDSSPPSAPSLSSSPPGASSSPQPPLPTTSTSTAVSSLPGQCQKGGMLESILTLLVEEVRELKKSNQDLHKEVVLLREKQEQTDEKVERISQTAPAQPMLLNIPSPFLATSHIQKELYRLMPFLAYYRIKKGSFVIDDIRKPFIAMQVPDMSTMRGWGMLPCGLGMPQIISANRIFCSVFQLPLHQLVGSPFSAVCRNETNKRLICRFAKGNGGVAVSDPIDATCTNRTPTGKVRNLKTRLQIFYGPDGQMKWLVSVFDSMVEHSSEHEPVTITFPSPLLSCLAEEDSSAGDVYSTTTTRPDHLFFPSSPAQSSSPSPSSPFSSSSSASPLSPAGAGTSSLLPVGTMPPPVFSSMISVGGYHTIPGLFQDDERFQLMEEDDENDNIAQQQHQQQQNQHQNQQQQDGFLQDLYSPSMINPSPPASVMTPFLPSPLSAQDDLSWLLASSPKPIPSPPPIRYQD